MQVNDNIPPPILAKINEVIPNVRGAFQRALAGGVNIAFGTDCGVSPHGQNAREFELMVEYGMSPIDAIRSATVMTARLLDRTHDLGTIEPGKAANLASFPLGPAAPLRRFTTTCST